MNHVRRPALVVLGALVAGFLSACSGSTTPVISTAPANRPLRGVATPDATQLTAGCQLPDPQRELGPEPTLKSTPVDQLVKPSGGVWTFAAGTGSLYVVNGNGLDVYTLGGKLRRHVALPASIVHATSNGQPVGSGGVSQPVVAPDGDVFISSYYGRSVVELSPEGRALRTVGPKEQNPTNVFALRSAAGTWELGVSFAQDHKQSLVYRTNGHRVGSVRLWAPDGSFLSRGVNGDLLEATGSGMVDIWDPTATRVLSRFGDGRIHGDGVHTGGSYDFYYPGEAAAGDGTIYAVNGPSTLTATRPDGELIGATTFDDTFEATSYLAQVGRYLYVQTGPAFDDSAAVISRVALSMVRRYLDRPQAAANVLGWGAGLDTSAAGNYFSSGRRPAVYAGFESWWARLAPHLKLVYRIWDDASITDGKTPTSRTIRLPDRAAALAHVGLRLPSVDTTPGPYEVEAELYDTATSPPRQLGATCLPYTVGAVGDRLDLQALPSGIGAGGPADTRGVVLNAQLGLDGLRSSQTVDWSAILPGCGASSPSAATCGPSALRLGQASQIPFRAAYLATKHHVRYWVQVSGGDAISKVLVDNGWWQADVEALVKYYSSPPAGCHDCAAVTTWEPWNEPNNTGWSNASSYVKEVLGPFYRAVKAAKPTDTVIGGSTLEVDLSWWKGLVAAGGLHDLDVAAVHPYTGNNDSWEEDGIPSQLEHLESLLGRVPLWLSEVGWWSNGDYNFLAQADIVSRAMIWQRVLHIPVWNYFIDEGSFSTSGSFSLIEAANGSSGDDYVKPSALAVMTAVRQLAGRTSSGIRNPGIPQTYVAHFGPSPSSPQDLLAVWTDGLSATASLVAAAPGGGRVPITITTQYGQSHTAQLRSGVASALHISDQVVYLSYPHGDTLRTEPTETYGRDLALATQGATASATSGNPQAVLINPAKATSYGQGWTSSASDSKPAITVRLARPARINRVLVDTQSMGSTASGVRDYTISVRTPAKRWRRVGAVAGQFRHHVRQVAFAPVQATAVRISVTMVNIGGYYGGGVPPFCTYRTCVAKAFLHAIEIYAGSSSPATVNGADLTRLRYGAGQ